MYQPINLKCIIILIHKKLRLNTSLFAHRRNKFTLEENFSGKRNIEQNSYLNNKACICRSPRSIIAADRVPPVATKSSIIMTRSFCWTAPTCISKQSVPYSRTYFSEITSPEHEASQSLGMNVKTKLMHWNH